MSILEALSHLIVITWWTLGIWSIVTGAIWYTWDRRKIRPLKGNYKGKYMPFAIEAVETWAARSPTALEKPEDWMVFLTDESRQSLEASSATLETDPFANSDSSSSLTRSVSPSPAGRSSSSHPLPDEPVPDSGARTPASSLPAVPKIANKMSSRKVTKHGLLLFLGALGR